MGKHTPGPWTVDVSHDEPTMCIRQFVSRCMEAIANRPPVSLASETEATARARVELALRDEHEANARLTAVAPESIEVLRACLACLDFEGHEHIRRAAERVLEKADCGNDE